MTGQDVVTVARTALDVPFRHQGRTLRGLDCVGLLIYVANQLGIPVVDVDGYPRRPGDGLLEQAFDAHVASGTLVRVAMREMQAGDLPMMRFGREPQHLAVFTGAGIVHSYEKAGKVCEHGLTPEWHRRIVRVYRFAEVTS